jgi:hypothetical protein
MPQKKRHILLRRHIFEARKAILSTLVAVRGFKAKSASRTIQANVLTEQKFVIF